MSTVIEVDDVWKKYRLGIIGTGTLRHDFERWWHRVRGKPDPYSKLDQGSEIRNRKSELATNVDHRISGVSASLGEDEVWALREVSFQVEQGEILGIIGRNGAGKSTVLKILSRVTAPTSGEVRVKGRIASLLEVGTGFHPELTGRENVFLNGAILGMTKAEIRSKLDEIIDFSGVEKFIDTPVKRYSSGMYVRLAFAVAAHLDPEILVVDEVLAVGDGEFQQKCVGKMKEVNREGRTVLFVSHNMAAVQKLCGRGIYLARGTIKMDDTALAAIEEYQRSSGGNHILLGRKIALDKLRRWGGDGRARMASLHVYDPSSPNGGECPVRQGDVAFCLKITGDTRAVRAVGVHISDLADRKIVNCNTLELGRQLVLEPNDEVRLVIHDLKLRPGLYSLGLWLGESDGTPLDVITEGLPLEILPPVGRDFTSEGNGVYECAFSCEIGRSAGT